MKKRTAQVLIHAYKNGSRGAKRLKAALNESGVPTYVLLKQPTNTKALLVNWGASEFKFDPNYMRYVVNSPAVVGVMTNKKSFFTKVGDSPMVPEWTTLPAEALAWRSKLLARTILQGSGGAGIVVWDPEKDDPATLPTAPLYVKYENKTHEFRIHLARSFYGHKFEPILIQRKIFQKGKGLERPLSWEIRNHSNGFVFVRDSGEPTPPEVLSTSIAFMDQHFPQLHFVALDVIYHAKKNQAWVLEGNTAPGLEGNTIEVYKDYFARLNSELRRVT